MDLIDENPELHDRISNIMRIAAQEIARMRDPSFDEIFITVNTFKSGREAGRVGLRSITPNRLTPGPSGSPSP